MKLPTVIRIDSLFLPLQRALEFIFNNSGSITQSPSTKVIAIKLVGKGSLIRLISLCHELAADVDQLVLITFEEHRDICELFKIRNVQFIRTKSLFHFVYDCWLCLRMARKISPCAVVSLERCSFAVNSFGLLLSMRSRCKNILFESGHRASSEKIIIQNADELSLSEIFKTCIKLLPKSIEEGRRQAISINQKKILININASDLLSARRYSVQQFASVIRHLHTHNKEWEFVFTGSSSEKEYVESLVKELPGIPVVNNAGKWTLVKLAQEMMTSSLVITGDSMPVHLAAYLEIPVVALWGPTQPQHFGYSNQKNVHSISLGLSCSPCFLHPRSMVAVPCRGKIDCLSTLNPIYVSEVCLKIMQDKMVEGMVNVPIGLREVVKN